MTNITEFNTVPCPKINALDVDAFLGLSLDPLSLTTLNLESSWGVTGLDLTPAIKAGETITHLFLTPSENPNALQFNREDYGVAGAPANGIDCITGVELGSIIPMGTLKDVDSTMAMMDGGVYMYDQSITRFQPFNLQSFIDNTNDTLQALTGATGGTAGNLLGLQSQVTNLDNRVTNLEQGSGLTPEEKAKLDSLVTITAIGDNLTLTDGTLSATGGGGSAPTLKTINNESLIGTGNIAVQPTLVSGTNIKTVNGSSLLGSGNITISAPTWKVDNGSGYPAGTLLPNAYSQCGTLSLTPGTYLAIGCVGVLCDTNSTMTLQLNLGSSRLAAHVVEQTASPSQNAAVNHCITLMRSVTVTSTSTLYLEIQNESASTGTFAHSSYTLAAIKL